MSTEFTGMVPVPADIDRPDRVLWGLTGRQVVILAPVALIAVLIWKRLLGEVPMPVLVGVTAPVLGIAAALALGRIDGLDGDRLAFAALTAPRRPLAAGRGTTAMLAAPGARRRGRAGALRGPVRDLGEDGLLDLGRAGVAVGLGVECVNFDLRSTAEQADLIGAFARLLHSLEVHCQVVMSTRPVDLGGYLESLAAAAEDAVHPRVVDAAFAHRDWLSALVRTQRLLSRELTVVVRAADAAAAERAAEQVAAFAEAIGADAWRLDDMELAERIRAAVDPFGTPIRGLS